MNTKKELNDLEKDVLDRFVNCEDTRIKEVMTSVVRHMHACIKEIGLTQEEWFACTDFLEKAGQISDDFRKEFFLISDLLGVTTLTIDQNVKHAEGAIEDTLQGPYYWEDVPHFEMGDDIAINVLGDRAFYSGKVLDTYGKPIEGAVLDLWSGNGEGDYDMQLANQDAGLQIQARGVFKVGKTGEYNFWSIKPKFYPVPQDGPAGVMIRKLKLQPNRPGHIHFKISASGFVPVTSQLYASDSEFLENDAVFGVKKNLIIDYTHHEAGSIAPDMSVVDEDFYTTSFDFIMTKCD